ncbi:hypothetical protein RQP46_001701 [Phenoliferia psychrophenolica]
MSWSLGNMRGVALITGAASGIGREAARAFAKLGTKLVLVDRNLAGLEVLQAELALPPSHCIIEGIDVTDLKRLAEFIRSIPARMGGLHFLINCSGILGPDYDTPLDGLPDGHWEMVLDINLKAPAIITRECVVGVRRGVIINLGSTASQKARSASGAPYITSKHGLVGLSKVTAVSYGKDGIRCNTVAPGFVATALTAGIAAKVDQIASEIIPMNRVAEAQEVADLIVFLCSERASYVNGALVSIDGGWAAT